MISLDEEKQEKTMKILETDRLLLRHLLPGDLDDLTDHTVEAKMPASQESL